MMSASRARRRTCPVRALFVSLLSTCLMSNPWALGFSITGAVGVRRTCRGLGTKGRGYGSLERRARSSPRAWSPVSQAQMALADGPLSQAPAASSAASSTRKQQADPPIVSAHQSPATSETTVDTSGAHATVVETSTTSTAVSAAGKESEQPRSQRLQVAMFFFFWYSFNVGYNLCTKFTLNVLPLPVMLAAVQLLVGVPYACALWLTGVRKAPALSPAKLRRTTPVAAAHTMAHLAAVVSIGAGAVGFVQVVKGAEPLFTSVLSCLTGSRMPWPVYLTLLPVIGGVGMASAGEISFSIIAFGAAMTSNASAASRSVLGKMYMAKEKEGGSSMDAGNLYAVMTMLGCLVLTPLAVALEGPKVSAAWDAALAAGHSSRALVKNCLLSGLFFYLYNEVSFYALNIIHPVTHALGNTLKRVVMITVSVLVLNHKFTPLGLTGCCTAIGGVLAYSVAKAKLQTDVGPGSGKAA